MPHLIAMAHTSGIPPLDGDAVPDSRVGWIAYGNALDPSPEIDPSGPGVGEPPKLMVRGSRLVYELGPGEVIYTTWKPGGLSDEVTLYYRHHRRKIEFCLLERCPGLVINEVDVVAVAGTTLAVLCRSNAYSLRVFDFLIKKRPLGEDTDAESTGVMRHGVLLFPLAHILEHGQRSPVDFTVVVSRAKTGHVTGMAAKRGRMVITRETVEGGPPTDSRITLFDLSGGSTRVVAECGLPCGDVRLVSISDDGRTIAIVSRDNQLILINWKQAVASFKEAKRKFHELAIGGRDMAPILPDDLSTFLQDRSRAQGFITGDGDAEPILLTKTEREELQRCEDGDALRWQSGRSHLEFACMPVFLRKYQKERIASEQAEARRAQAEKAVQDSETELPDAELPEEAEFPAHSNNRRSKFAQPGQKVETLSTASFPAHVVPDTTPAFTGAATRTALLARRGFFIPPPNFEDEQDPEEDGGFPFGPGFGGGIRDQVDARQLALFYHDTVEDFIIPRIHPTDATHLSGAVTCLDVNSTGQFTAVGFADGRLHVYNSMYFDAPAVIRDIRVPVAAVEFPLHSKDMLLAIGATSSTVYELDWFGDIMRNYPLYSTDEEPVAPSQRSPALRELYMRKYLKSALLNARHQPSILPELRRLRAESRVETQHQRRNRLQRDHDARNAGLTDSGPPSYSRDLGSPYLPRFPQEPPSTPIPMHQSLNIPPIAMQLCPDVVNNIREGQSSNQVFTRMEQHFRNQRGGEAIQDTLGDPIDQRELANQTVQPSGPGPSGVPRDVEFSLDPERAELPSFGDWLSGVNLTSRIRDDTDDERLEADPFLELRQLRRREAQLQELRRIEQILANRRSAALALGDHRVIAHRMTDTVISAFRYRPRAFPQSPPPSRPPSPPQPPPSPPPPGAGSSSSGGGTHLGSGRTQSSSSGAANGRSQSQQDRRHEDSQGGHDSQDSRGGQDDQGSQGNSGSQGDQGSQGSQGNQGSQESKGGQGGQGDQNSQGSQGNDNNRDNRGTGGNQDDQGNQDDEDGKGKMKDEDNKNDDSGQELEEQDDDEDDKDYQDEHFQESQFLHEQQFFVDQEPSIAQDQARPPDQGSQYPQEWQGQPHPAEPARNQPIWQPMEDQLPQQAAQASQSQPPRMVQPLQAVQPQQFAQPQQAVQPQQFVQAAQIAYPMQVFPPAQQVQHMLPALQSVQPAQFAQPPQFAPPPHFGGSSQPAQPPPEQQFPQVPEASREQQASQDPLPTQYQQPPRDAQFSDKENPPFTEVPRPRGHPRRSSTRGRSSSRGGASSRRGAASRARGSSRSRTVRARSSSRVERSAQPAELQSDSQAQQQPPHGGQDQPGSQDQDPAAARSQSMRRDFERRLAEQRYAHHHNGRRIVGLQQPQLLQQPRPLENIERAQQQLYLAHQQPGQEFEPPRWPGWRGHPGIPTHGYPALDRHSQFNPVHGHPMHLNPTQFHPPVGNLVHSPYSPEQPVYGQPSAVAYGQPSPEESSYFRVVPGLLVPGYTPSRSRGAADAEGDVHGQDDPRVYAGSVLRYRGITYLRLYDTSGDVLHLYQVLMFLPDGRIVHGPETLPAQSRPLPPSASSSSSSSSSPPPSPHAMPQGRGSYVYLGASANAGYGYPNSSAYREYLSGPGNAGHADRSPDSSGSSGGSSSSSSPGGAGNGGGTNSWSGNYHGYGSAMPEQQPGQQYQQYQRYQQYQQHPQHAQHAQQLLPPLLHDGYAHNPAEGQAPPLHHQYYLGSVWHSGEFQYAVYDVCQPGAWAYYGSFAMQGWASTCPVQWYAGVGAAAAPPRSGEGYVQGATPGGQMLSAPASPAPSPTEPKADAPMEDSWGDELEDGSGPEADDTPMEDSWGDELEDGGGDPYVCDSCCRDMEEACSDEHGHGSGDGSGDPYVCDSCIRNIRSESVRAGRRVYYLFAIAEVPEDEEEGAAGAAAGPTDQAFADPNSSSTTEFSGDEHDKH